MKTILYIIGFSGWGGSEQQLCNVLEVLSKKLEYRTIVITDHVKGPLFQRYEKFSDLVWQTRMSNPNFRIEDEAGLRNIVRGNDVDLIHLQRPGGEGVPIDLFPYIGDIPICLTTLCDRDEGDIERWVDAHVLPSKFSYDLQTKLHSEACIICHSVKYHSYQITSAQSPKRSSTCWRTSTS